MGQSSPEGDWMERRGVAGQGQALGRWRVVSDEHTARAGAGS